MELIMILGFLNIGTGELVPILLIALLLFGGKKLPELARGLGKGIREFKEASEDVKREIHRNINALDHEDELKAQEEQERLAKAHHEQASLPVGSKPIDDNTHDKTDKI